MEGQSAESVRTQYTISVDDERFKVTGIDPVDGEEFLIFDISYNGEYLMFTSVMPSTNTQARTWMRVIDQEKVECRWTITETEVWHRSDAFAGGEPWLFLSAMGQHVENQLYEPV